MTEYESLSDVRIKNTFAHPFKGLESPLAASPNS